MVMILNELQELVMVKEVCHAAVLGVAKSQTLLRDLTHFRYCQKKKETIF